MKNITKKEMKNLLYRSHPFLVHALCTIPNDSAEYKEAYNILQELESILYKQVLTALEKNKCKFNAVIV